MRKDDTIRNMGMKMEDTPQHWSIKNLAVARPNVPIQLCARSPSTQVESSVTVKRCETRLRKIKLLIMNNTAPMQKRVISARDILSLLSVSAVSEEPFQKLRIF